MIIRLHLKLGRADDVNRRGADPHTNLPSVHPGIQLITQIVADLLHVTFPVQSHTLRVIQTPECMSSCPSGRRQLWWYTPPCVSDDPSVRNDLDPAGRTRISVE